MHFCSILQMFFVTSILQLLVFGHAEHDFMDLATFRLDKIPLNYIWWQYEHYIKFYRGRKKVLLTVFTSINKIFIGDIYIKVFH